MLISLYVFSPKGAAFLTDSSVVNMLHTHHVWSPDGATWVYGVVNIRDNVHPLELVDALTALGVHVLPGVNDPAAVHPTVAGALSKHGVSTTDSAHACAMKMHAASGMKSLRPHKY